MTTATLEGERADETETLQIESLSAGGEGVARDATGRVVFVAATCPGDTVRARITRAGRSFARGKLIQVIKAGPSRRTPRCPKVGECGGCSWQHIAYTEQCRAKAQRVSSAFARIAGALPEAPVVCHPCPSPFAYRSRARLGFRRGQVGYRRPRSHTLCPVTECAVLTPELDAALLELSKHPPRGQGELTLAAGDDGRVSISGDGRAAAATRLQVEGDAFEVSPGGFFQANALLRTELARAVHTAAGRGERVLELFAGAGFLTFGLARRFAQVLVVEAQGRASRDLEKNLAAAKLRNVTVVSGAAERELKSPRLAAFDPEVLVLDPPRKGLTALATARIATLAPRRIVYLACDPATQARDVRRLRGHGYRLTKLSAFDLFPQTPHVETLAVLVRLA